MAEHRIVAPPPPVMTDLAWVAIESAALGDWASVDAAMEAALDYDPQAGIGYLALLWCDFYIIHATDGHPELAKPTTGEIRYCLPDGTPATDEDITPAATWAAHLIDARARKDRDTYWAITDQLDTMPAEQRLHHYRVLVLTVANAMRLRPPGWTLHRPAP